MLTRVRTSGISGVDAISVDVEVEVREGKQYFMIIGLADGAIRESRDRVQTAMRQSGCWFPEQVLINLSPAEVKKEGSGFDLALAVGILLASGQIKCASLQHSCFHGELALDGKVKGVRGMLALAVEAKRHGIRKMFVPRENAAEAALIEGLDIYPLDSLLQIVSFLQGNIEIEKWAANLKPVAPDVGPLVSEVWGQVLAKRALLIAAAGGHNLLMIGPPGCGKSMLAERLPSLLPSLSNQEKLDAIKVHSIAGLSTDSLIHGIRPMRSPHHTVSDAGLVGGGCPPRPGEISLAHSGVLFLDEFPEFRRSALESLRAPLETGTVRISRAKGSVLLPARFQLVAAMNPCPCGRLGGVANGCLCSRAAIFSYLRKLSQPMLDRIDLHVELQRVPLKGRPVFDRATLVQQEQELRAQVLKAVDIQRGRQGKLNALLNGREIGECAGLSLVGATFLETYCEKLSLSARTHSRLIKVARTIADLSGIAIIEERHIAEAIQLRSLENIERYCRAA